MAFHVRLAIVAAALLAMPALASCKVPQAEDAAVAFIDELVTNLTSVADAKHSCSQESSRTVDLVYAKYEGYHDEGADLNIWKG